MAIEVPPVDGSEMLIDDKLLVALRKTAYELKEEAKNLPSDCPHRKATQELATDILASVNDWTADADLRRQGIDPNALSWKRTEFGTAGYVQYIDHLGSDASIVEQARLTAQSEGRSDAQDTQLLEYLMRHRHTTPFEFAEIIFEIQLPIDVARQLIRHRTANCNEYSTRYSPAIDMQNLAGPYRVQAKSNRQGSDGVVDDTLQDSLGSAEEETVEAVKDFYKHMLDEGVSREQARRVLPLSTYTKMRWKLDVHNLFHFLGLRLDSHAQLEIREMAGGIANIVKKLYPKAWDAFYTYRLKSITLSGRDVAAMHELVAHDVEDLNLPVGARLSGKVSFRLTTEDEFRKLATMHYPTKRELDEAVDKFLRLGLIAK